MTWAVEYTDEFEVWWLGLDADEQESVAGSVGVQHKGSPYRILYAFDSRRTAILLIGGCKAGDNRFYKTMIPKADRLYDEHLETLRMEGLIDD